MAPRDSRLRTAEGKDLRTGSGATLGAFVLAMLLLTGCRGQLPVASSESTSTSITVFAASSLTEAFSEIGVAFETANPGVKVVLNFSGSQTLRTQIEAGAVADVFASANVKEMDALVNGGLVAADSPQNFLTNRLVIILPAGNPAGVMQLQDLAQPGLKLILAAEEVPVGGYARQAIEKMNTALGANFSEQVAANVVSNEDNVRQVVAKVQLGEADAGIVYASDSVAAPDLETIELPLEFNVIASYPIAPMQASTHVGAARKFIAYVLSPQGGAILKKWGFAPPH